VLCFVFKRKEATAFPLRKFLCRQRGEALAACLALALKGVDLVDAQVRGLTRYLSWLLSRGSDDPQNGVRDVLSIAGVEKVPR